MQIKEFHQHHFTVKNLSENGCFSGYASVFNVEDHQHDVVLPGAFAQSLQNIREKKRHIKLLWQHHPEQPIGVFTQIKEDKKGLYVEGKLLLDIEKGREVYSLLKSGAVDSMSIGYHPITYYYDEAKQIRYLQQVDLWEISLVTFPANDQATVTAVKHNNQPQHRFNDDEVARLGIAIEKAISVLL